MTEPAKPPERPRGSVVKTKKGLWQMRIRLADGTRVRSKPFPAGTSEAYAREKAAYWAEQHKDKTAADLGRPPSPVRQRQLPRPTAETKGGWWDRYFDHRESLGFYETRGVYRKHVLPIVGQKPPKEITQEDSRKLRRYLDDRAACKVGKKTAKNIWGIWTTACKAACGRWHEDKVGPLSSSPPSGPDVGPSDPAELALLRVIEQASEAGQWSLVDRLLAQLEARRGQL